MIIPFLTLDLLFLDAAEDALDIAFAFGASGSEAHAVFKKEKEMINIFIDSLKVHDTQYGVIEYSSEARVHATLGQFSRKERLKAQVNMYCMAVFSISVVAMYTT